MKGSIVAAVEGDLEVATDSAREMRSLIASAARSIGLPLSSLGAQLQWRGAGHVRVSICEPPARIEYRLGDRRQL